MLETQKRMLKKPGAAAAMPYQGAEVGQLREKAEELAQRRRSMQAYVDRMKKGNREEQKK